MSRASRLELHESKTFQLLSLALSDAGLTFIYTFTAPVQCVPAMPRFSRAGLLAGSASGKPIIHGGVDMRRGILRAGH